MDQMVDTLTNGAISTSTPQMVFWYKKPREHNLNKKDRIGNDHPKMGIIKADKNKLETKKTYLVPKTRLFLIF